jgi:ABC-type uncharacterized transport system auxiliary subunit
MGRAVLVLACGLLLAALVAGCQTTQETAALHQAESKRILAARKHKHEHNKHKERDERAK